ncbi:hypothetical protein AVEN_34713-1 [Araneus ventricosus]|uniref:Uncharacterized protein n=1 Tax=Araneus ventricosus TaxID=182803 RepID=A0A4Y2B0G4_ARAVE|nr:hypothetical protein AVEN_34713-1 [Araneus ventricosus]
MCSICNTFDSVSCSKRVIEYSAECKEIFEEERHVTLALCSGNLRAFLHRRDLHSSAHNEMSQSIESGEHGVKAFGKAFETNRSSPK